MSDKPKQANTTTYFESRFFWVGVVVLAFTLVLIGYVIWGPPICSAIKVKLINVMLGLSGGFIAWTFSGAMKLDTKAILPGVGIAAGGGFAVFFLLTHVLDLGGIDDQRCSSTKDSPQVVTQRLFSEIAFATLNVNTSMIQKTAAKVDLGSVHLEAKSLLERMNGVEVSHLSMLQSGMLSLYKAHAAVIAAMTVEKSAAAAKDARSYASVALTVAESALAKFSQAKSGNGGDAIAYLAKHGSEEKARYLAGVAKIIRMHATTVDGAAESVTDADVYAAFAPVSVSFLREASASADGPVKWFCESKVRGNAPCL
jgi:hypothetical protein